MMVPITHGMSLSALRIWFMATASSMLRIKGSTLTLSEIEAGGKEYLRTDVYDKNGYHRL